MNAVRNNQVEFSFVQVEFSFMDLVLVAHAILFSFYRLFEPRN